MEIHESYHVSAGASFDSRLPETSCHFLIFLVSFSCSEVLWLVVDSTWSHSFSLDFSREASLGAPHSQFSLCLALCSSLVFSSLLFSGYILRLPIIILLISFTQKKKIDLMEILKLLNYGILKPFSDNSRMSLQDTRQLSRFLLSGAI